MTSADASILLQVGYLTKVRLGQIQPAGFEPLFEYLQQHLQSIM